MRRNCGKRYRVEAKKPRLSTAAAPVFSTMSMGVDEYIAGCDLLLRKAESKMEMETYLPGQFASILRMDAAALSRHEKSLVMAIAYKRLRFEDMSANMRRLSGSCGCGSRQATLLSGEATGSHASDRDLDVLAAHRKAKKQRWVRQRRKVLPRRVGIRRRGTNRH